MADLATAPGTVLQELARSAIDCERSEPNDAGCGIFAREWRRAVLTPTWRRSYIRGRTYHHLSWRDVLLLRILSA